MSAAPFTAGRPVFGRRLLTRIVRYTLNRGHPYLGNILVLVYMSEVDIGKLSSICPIVSQLYSPSS